MQFVDPISWDDALELIGDKSPIGAALSSSEWSDVPVALRQRAMFSANVENVRFLQRAQDGLMDFLTANKVATPDGDTMLKTGGRAAFIQQMREFAQAEGMGPLDPADEGGLQDITSERRLGLIFDTLTTQAGSYGFWKQGQDSDVLNEFPAMRFIRVVDVKEPRQSHEQYQDQVYLKNDPIWSTRINQDFGVPWAPFGWGCGHDTEDVDRDESVQLGLINDNQRVEPDTRNFNDNLQASTRGLDPDLIEKMKNAFGDQLSIDGDSMAWSGSATGQSATVATPAVTPPAAPSIASQNQNPVSAAIQVNASGALKGIVKAALSAIDNVHDDGALPQIPLDDNSGGYLGVMRFNNKTMRAVNMAVDSAGPWRALTAVHEAGHLLDLEAIGAKGSWATLSYPDMLAVLKDADNSARIKDLRNSLAQSTSWRYQGKLRYLLEPQEIWARAYAQFIATKSGNNTLLKDLAELRKKEPQKAWTDADFQPISDAIEKMFKNLGWI